MLIPTWFGLRVAGGCQSHVRSLVQGLEAIGHQVTLLTADDVPDWAALSRTMLAPVYALSRERYRVLRTMWGRNAYRRDIARRFCHRPVNLVHTHDVIVASLFADWRPPPLVLTVHGYAAYEAASVKATSEGRPYFEVLKRLEAMAYHAADAIIAVDSRLREYVLSYGVAPERVSVIPNSVDTSLFSPGAPDRNFTGQAILLCPRRLVPKNGPQVALRSVPILMMKHHLTVCLVFAGDGPMAPALREEAGRLGIADRVHFLGSVPHGSMPAWYRAADAVIIPSVPTDGIEEATSIAALEGMACGRPVVASSIGGLAELIEDGNNGLLVPAGTPEGLADALARVLMDKSLAKHLGGTAVRQVQSHFSPSRWIRRNIEVYERLI